MTGKSPEDGTRIIAVSNPSTVLGRLFNGITVNEEGDIRVGDVTLNKYELGPVVVKCVTVLNDYVESLTDHELPENRAMIYHTAGVKRERAPKFLETIGDWVYSPENVDIRILLLEAVVRDMRNRSLQPH